MPTETQMFNSRVVESTLSEAKEELGKSQEFVADEQLGTDTPLFDEEYGG